MQNRIARMFTIATLAVASLAAATGSPEWSSLAGLKAGDIIEVRQTGRSTVTGTYRSNSAEGLVLELAGADSTLAKSAVVRVSLLSKTHRVKHAVIFGVIGGLAGAGVTKFGHGCSDTIDGCHNARVVTSAGAAGGAIIGALWPAHRTVIYRVGK